MGEKAAGTPSNATGFAAAFATMLSLFGVLPTGSLAADEAASVTGKRRVKPRLKPRRSVPPAQVTRATRR